MPSNRFLILRAKPFQESDLILDVLAKDGERMTLSAKNALRSQKRFGGGVLEPLNFIECLYTQSQAGHYYIQEAQVLQSFTGLRTRYDRLECAFYFLKLIQKTTFAGLQDNHALFDLLGNSLKALETSDSIEKLKVIFEVKLLHILGYLEIDDRTELILKTAVRYHEKVNLSLEDFAKLKSRMQKQWLEMQILQKEAGETF